MASEIPANSHRTHTDRKRRGCLDAKRVPVLAWGFTLLLSVGSGAAALEPATSLASYGRQGWLTENGLPQNTVQTLAQTPDGFLWLGTEVGLVRFDGNGFTAFDQHSRPALPGNDVQCLLAATDGALWVGTTDGLVRIKDGRVLLFTTAQGLPGNSVRRLEQNGDEVRIWTGNGTARARINPIVASLLPDAGAEPQPAPRTEPEGIEFRTHLPDGVEVLGTKTAVTLRQNGRETQHLDVARELPGTRIQALWADREGALWIGTNSGLVRSAGGKLEKLPVTDPLASASVLAILEDREGDLWVGTEASGLQILRDQRFRMVTTRDGLSSDNTTAVVQDRTGILWVGTAGYGVTALRPGTDAGSNGGARPAARTWSVRDGLLSDVVLSLAAAPNGDLWVGTADGLSRIRGGTVESFTAGDGLPDDFIRSLSADADGSLWVGTRRGLTHWKSPGDLSAGAMETFTLVNGLGSDLVGAMARDSAGELWVATFAGLSRIAGGSIRNFTSADGLSSNVITALLPRANGALLIGTQDHGWNLWDGKQFQAVTQDNLQRTSIRAILDDGAGHLWFATGSGLARCDCENRMGPMGSADCEHWMEFGAADGLRSRETAANSHPSAWRAQDGRLWFATPKGLVEVDPAHFTVNAVPPPVAVERFAVDDADQELGSTAPLRIPAGHNHFQFEYAGLSFVAPQKVRYRYMLQGFDKGWTEAGVRRTAYYTNIPPGAYTFRVQAANNDGLWNMQGADLRFELRPHFYQTAWFYVLLAVLLLGAVLLVLRLRLLRAEREFKAVLGERNRIAREIHDTLAQGYVGISVQLEVLSELLRLKKVDAAARHLDTTRGFVREGLADARQSIWALRSQDSNEATLPVRIRRLAEQGSGHGLEARFSTYGAYRPLPPGTEQEIARIAQEAVHNVKKHAGASDVWVQLEYRPSEVALEVRDDGRGFVVGEPSPAGHYGLTGMRERSAMIGATLEISSEPGSGTTVRLRVPAANSAKASAETILAKDENVRQDAKE